jgi:serine/threonine-protein phosphatase 2A regulatory subunit A
MIKLIPKVSDAELL